MAEAYAVAATFTLESDAPKILRDLIEGFEKLRNKINEAAEDAEKFGRAGSAITRMVNSLSKLQDMRFPTSLVEGAEQLQSRLGEASEKMEAFARQAKEAAAAFRDMRMPSGGSGGGGHGGGHGDPVMQGIAGGVVLEFMGGSFKDFASVDQIYKKMADDQRINPAVMQKIRAGATAQGDKYKDLSPLDLAKNAAEGYGLSGGNMAEQGAISDMLNRFEQNLLVRGKSPEDANSQAKAAIKAMDISNQFYNKQTGEMDMGQANKRLDTMLAIISASGGFVTGQNLLAFEKASGRAGQGLSIQGEAELAHFIDVNPSRSATALRSFQSLFGNGGIHMFKNYRHFWETHGGPDGKGIFKQDGTTVDDKLRQENPVEWMLKEFKGISDNDVDANIQRMNVSGQTLETFGSIGNIRRQAATVNSINAGANEASLENSPQGKLIAFSAAMERFRVALGGFEAGPGSKILGGLTDGLTRLTAFMNSHPDFTEGFLKLTAALAAFAVVRGAASLLGLGGALGGLSKGLSFFVKGTAGASAIEALGATAGAGSLFGVAAGFIAVGAALVGLAPLLKYLAGDASQNPHPNTNAHGMGYSGRAPVAAGPLQAPGQTWSDYLKQAWQDSLHPQGHSARGLSGAIHRESYETDGSSGRAVTLVVNLDGREIARNTTGHQSRMMRTGVLAGSNNSDYSAMPMPAGMRSI